MAELMPPSEIKELISQTGAGVELLRFGVSENLEHLPEQLKIAEKELLEYGSPEITLHGPFLDLNPASYESLVREATFRRFEQCYQAARCLGARKIVYHTCRIPATVYLEGWAERMADFWNRFLDGKEGITVCMENVFEPEYEGILQTAQAVSHPDFSICLDIGHVHCFSERPPGEWIHALKGRISHVHLHDNDGSRDAHLALSEGTIDLEEIFGALKTERNLTWTVECRSGEDVRKSIRILQKMTVQN